MKTICLAISVFLSLFAYSQEKGISPIHQQSTNSRQQTYAVAVGISDYQDEGIPDLRFADKDAEAFAAFLQSPAGGRLDEDHLKVLINEQATAAQFAIALDWLWEVVQENDRVIIYFSGHGDVERKSITQPGYLLCWDAPSRVYLAGGAMNVRDLNDVVSTLSVQNKAKVILVTDACRAGKLSGSGIGGSQATAANLAKQFANEIKILSCQPDEYSIEGEQWGGGRGAFSYHLLDGLSGMADGNADNTVNLREIRNYLEENVTEEVSPQNQNPMAIGDKTEKLTDVFPEILAQLKEGKRGQLQLFTATESRGIEDDVLAQADTNIVEMYLAFKQSLTDKDFLEPTMACADFYYEKLSQEPQLEKLHSSIRRNYAAALQDDAQQVMNVMLKSGLTELILKSAKYSDLYYNYPRYLERASELLGKDHYMYEILHARKYFFEGIMASSQNEARNAYRKALIRQPEMPHAMVYFVRAFEPEQQDSAMLYYQKAAALIPSWIEPYIAMADYRLKLKQPEKAEVLLNSAGKIDSTAILVWYKKAEFFRLQKKYDLAEQWYLKVIERIEGGGDICFPCAHLHLGFIYYFKLEDKKAEEHYKKAIQLDSTFYKGFIGLGSIFGKTNRYVEAEEVLNKALQLDSMNFEIHKSLGSLYNSTGRYEEAEKFFEKSLTFDSTNIFTINGLASSSLALKKYEKAKVLYLKILEVNPEFAPAWINLGTIYFETNDLVNAEEIFKKCLLIELPIIYPYAHNGLGRIYHKQEKIEDAEKQFNKAIELDSNYIDAYVNWGHAYLTNNRFKEAEELFLKVIQKTPNQYFGPSSMAASQSLQNKPNAALEWLEKAIQFNLPYVKIIDDPDFDNIKELPQFKALLKKHFPDQYKSSND